MKRLLLIVLILACLSGCNAENNCMDRALVLRNKMINCEGYRFKANITADYGDKLYTFVLNCVSDNNDVLRFEVISPDSIAGICGNLSGSGGYLTFDDQVLMFEMLADGQITPVSAVWLFVKSLKSGYIKGCTGTDSGMYIQIDDTYEEDAMQLDINTNGSDIPIFVEIIWRNKRIISIEVEDFAFM